MKKLIVIFLFLSGLNSLKAQQDVLVSQYMFNYLLLNPAYAGSKDYIMTTLLYRKQWAEWKGAPVSQVATIHGPLGLSNFGWGVLLSHDRIGVTDKTDAFLNASYHLRVSPKLKLSFGLRGGGGFYTYKNSDLVFWDVNDPAFQGDQVTRFLPNVGSGAYLYSEKFYLGCSVPTLISYVSTDNLNANPDNGELIPRQVRHYFGTVGYAFIVNPDFVIKPSVLVKHVPNTPNEYDFNLNLLLGKVLWVGGSYRTGDCIVALLELELGKQWRIGYSYDFTFSDVKNYSTGSHEVMLAYDFGYDIMKIKTPRYF